VRHAIDIKNSVVLTVCPYVVLVIIRRIDHILEKRAAPVWQLGLAKLTVVLFRFTRALKLPPRHATRVDLGYGREGDMLVA
jgi:hypothetical protein|tara:strand:- start:20365 stop:20607 length:243 start_codon:yes stop_codon:yes gene_type:complete